MLTTRRFSFWLISGVLTVISLFALATVPATANHDYSLAKAAIVADPTITPTPYPEIALAAINWANNTWVMESYSRIQTGTTKIPWRWHFTLNSKLLNLNKDGNDNFQKPPDLQFNEINWPELYEAYWGGSTSHMNSHIGTVILNLANYISSSVSITLGPYTYGQKGAMEALQAGYDAWPGNLRVAYWDIQLSTCNIYVGDVLSNLGIDLLGDNGHYTGASDIYLGREDSLVLIEDINSVRPGDIVAWPSPEPGVSAHVEIVTSIGENPTKFASRGGGRFPIGARLTYHITSDLRFFRVRAGSPPAPVIAGSALSGANRIHVANLPVGFNASLDRTKQETPTATAVRSTALNELPNLIWDELISFVVNLLPTYDYDDAQIDGVSTYCYRARTYLLGIPLATSNEVCLAPVQPLYPYNIQNVWTIPDALAPTKNLPALFDGAIADFALIHYTPEPVSIILEFKDRVTLSGLTLGLGGNPADPNAYSLSVVAANTASDLTGGGSYQAVVSNVGVPGLEAGVQVPFGRNVTAQYFKLTVVRNEGARHVHINELTPLFGTDSPAGEISGTVFDANDVLPHAYVQVCFVGGLCHVTTTDATGQYQVTGLKDGAYLVKAFPPAGSALLPGQLGPLTITGGTSLCGQDITLTGPTPPPPDTTITSVDTTAEGIPIVYWAEPLTLSTTGCTGGSAHYTITQEGIVKRSGSLTEGPSGTYTAQIAPLQPIHGAAHIEITIDCPNSTTTTIEFDIYIDPSGVVRTVEGDPIEEATVTLYHADTLTGPFEVVPDGSALMSPMNRRNADVTDSNGHFGWDVLAGFYKVRTEKSGCLSPDGLQEYVESAVLSIPPAVTDLDLRLSCSEPPPPTIGCKVAKGASQSLGNGQTTAITFDTQINDTTPNDDCWTPAQPGRLYARESGYYLAGGAITLKSAARSGKLVVIVRRGGGNWIQAHGTHLHTVDDTIYSVMTGMFYLNVGEYIEIVGYHTLGDGIKTYQAAGCEHCVNGWLMKIGD